MHDYKSNYGYNFTSLLNCATVSRAPICQCHLLPQSVSDGWFLIIAGSVIKGAKFLFQSRRPKNLRLYEKHGGYNEAFDDFEALKLDKIRKYGVIQ